MVWSSPSACQGNRQSEQGGEEEEEEEGWRGWQGRVRWGRVGWYAGMGGWGARGKREGGGRREKETRKVLTAERKGNEMGGGKRKFALLRLLWSITR